MQLIYEPLDDTTWPGEFTPDADRWPSRFSAGWSTVTHELAREVDALANGGLAGYTSDLRAVLQVPFARRLVRRDGGGLTSEAHGRAPRHPGVALSLDVPGIGPMRFATDRYRGAGGQGYLRDWQANVRAIVLTLEALRAVDRHGATRSAEQYRGWQALSAESVVLGGGDLTRGEAARVLADAAGMGDDPEARARLLDDPEAVRATYRAAARALHPDSGGVGGTALTLATSARDVLLGDA